MANKQAVRAATHSYSGFAVGMTVFAAVMAMTAGAFQVFWGLVALFNDEFYVVGRKWTFEFDITTWGWIHLLLGVVLAVAGFALFSGALWARIVVIAAAAVTCLAQFAALPYYPLWSLTILTTCVLVMWALIAHGKDIAGQE